ncbi:MAG TPA: TonB family protein [Thermoanaerobaculia bacterium]|nr:TonB family protein [Thermoanaerobaculia bacterium]
MDLQKDLIESGKDKPKGRKLRASVASFAIHAMLVAGIVFAGQQKEVHKVAAERPMDAFITRGAAAPPPPPPPPPPPAKSSGAPKSTPKVQPKPVEVPKITPMTPPVEIPRELPVTQPIPTPALETPVVDETPADTGGGATTGTGDAVNGVVGGVEGGVAGGIVGGEIGGVKGGEIGGVQGGVVGGTVGGQVGGTGTGTGGTGTGGDDAPLGDGPLRVGGNVKAPQIVTRVQPDYTESARKARIAGVVIVEAIIDENGNVDQVKVVKGLPAGLAEAAENAVRKWKFRPGTLNGRPVATIFNLTVNFKLD